MDFFRRFYTGNEVSKERKKTYKLKEKPSVDFHKISNKLNRISTEKKNLLKVDEKLPLKKQQQQYENSLIKEQLWSLQSAITDEKQSTSSLKSSSSSNKQGKLRSNDSINIEDETGSQSTLYSPFIERPEIIDQDYIRLPTTKKSYIDPPVDDIITSLPYPFRERKRTRQRTLRPENTSPLLPRDIKSRLDESPFEKQLELLNSQRHHSKQELSPVIDSWLSTTLKQAEPFDINNFDEFGNLKVER